MKILYLLQEFPYPPDTGPRAKVFNLIRYMASHNECHILSFSGTNTPDRREELRHEIPNIQIINLIRPRTGFALHAIRIFHLMRGSPAFLARWQTTNYVQALRQALQATHYDLVHLDGIAMAPYVGLCRGFPTVLSTTDAVSLAQHRVAKISENLVPRINAYLTSWFTARLERRWLPQTDKVHVVAEPDSQYLRARIPAADVDFIELAIPEELINHPDNAHDEESIPRVLFSGQLITDGIVTGLRNFLEEAYPAILSAFPDVQMMVLGRGAPPDLQRYLQKVPNVQFLPWVEDYFAEVRKAQVVIVPDRAGTGIKTRVLYAMALGKPVVGTPVALEGIAAENGVHCFIESSGQGLAQAVVELLRDTSLRRKVGQAARQLTLEKYSLEHLGPKWLHLYESAMMKHKIANKW